MKEKYTQFCERCGKQLYYLHCKLKCPVCGFQLDCTDLDLFSEKLEIKK